MTENEDERYKKNELIVTNNENCDFLREMIHSDDKSRNTKPHDKSTQYMCKICNYKTKRKNDYIKHIGTNKHKWNEEHGREWIKDSTVEDVTFTCDMCHMKYTHRSNLYRHKKRCKKKPKTEQNEILETLIEDNKKLKEEISEMKKKPQIVNHLYKNKYMNVVQFLNHDCKDALNLSDFVNGIQVSTNDLQYIEENGYVQGIQNSFIKQLSTTEENKRPIHCTDIKRKQFYIKENDIWDKDNENKQLMHALNTINMNQLKLLDDWKMNHEWFTNDKNHDKLNHLIMEMTQMYGDDKDKVTKKILHEISKATSLDKVEKDVS